MTDVGVTGSVPEGSTILVDTSVLIAHLEGVEPVALLATELVETCLRTGRNDGVISAITVGELLVRPMRTNTRAVDTTVAFLWDLPDLLIHSADFLVAAEAARIRATTDLDMPDAIILATGILTSADVLVTNDRDLARAARSAVPGIEPLVLADMVG